MLQLIKCLNTTFATMLFFDAKVWIHIGNWFLYLLQNFWIEKEECDIKRNSYLFFFYYKLTIKKHNPLSITFDSWIWIFFKWRILDAFLEA